MNNANRRKNNLWLDTWKKQYSLFTGILLQKKWKNIRDRYTRDLNSRKGKSGQAAKTTPPYMYTKQLSFLEDTVQFRHTSSSLDDTDSENSQTPENIVEAASTSEASPSDRKKEIGKKRKASSIESKLMEALESNAKRREKKEVLAEDDDRLFLLSLLPQLKLVPPHQKFLVRMEIMKTIHHYTSQPS